MGYQWDEVHDEAEILEHSISDRLLDAIDARLGRPAHDPHGDPIPAADGSVARDPAMLLSAAAPGYSGRVLRISDRDPAVLRDLAADSIGPGSALTVVEPSGTAARLIVRLPDGQIRRLSPAAAELIWVST